MIFFTFPRLNSDPNLRLGDVTSLNVTMLSGGVQYNVVPDSMSLGLDIRVTLSDDHEVAMCSHIGHRPPCMESFVLCNNSVCCNFQCCLLLSNVST